jgi:hypothetical protein
VFEVVLLLDAVAVAVVLMLMMDVVTAVIGEDENVDAAEKVQQIV